MLGYNIIIDYIYQWEVITYRWKLGNPPGLLHTSWYLLAFLRVCWCAQSLHNALGTSLLVLQKWVCFFLKFLWRHRSQHLTFPSFSLKKTNIICSVVTFHTTIRASFKSFQIAIKSFWIRIHLKKTLSAVFVCTCNSECLRFF